MLKSVDLIAVPLFAFLKKILLTLIQLWDPFVAGRKINAFTVKKKERIVKMHPTF